MYIMDACGNMIVNSDFVERFLVVDKDDASLVVASYNDVRKAVTLGRYDRGREAREVLGSMLSALADDKKYFVMPDSHLSFPEKVIKDARTKRKGGS